MKCRTYKCKACCCYNVPFPRPMLEDFKDKIITPILHMTPMGDRVIPVTSLKGVMDNKCPFLRADYKCNIYEHRPDVCRLMGTIAEMPCKYIKQ